jgi:predicted MFS family arabinose efflux permease
LFTTSALIIGTETLLPVLDQGWHGGALGYGLLRMAPGIAAVATGAVLSLRTAARRPERTITLSVLTACAALIAFADAPAIIVAFMLFAAGSVALSTAQIHVFTRVQQITPDHLRGAVGGFNAMTQSGLGGIAAAGMALAAAGAGATATITAVAAATAMTALAGVRYSSR